jgi:hypothetical protein
MATNGRPIFTQARFGSTIYTYDEKGMTLYAKAA